jgi:diguanylate cyclase (GGDEF)-like protein
VIIEANEHATMHLSGVIDHAAMGQCIDAVLDWARAQDRHVGLLFLDIDELDELYDAYGRGFGDELLRQAAERLAGVVRHGDAVARLGGDELAVVLADASKGEVMAAAARARAALEGPFSIGGLPIELTASVRQAIWPPPRYM